MGNFALYNDSSYDFDSCRNGRISEEATVNYRDNMRADNKQSYFADLFYNKPCVDDAVQEDFSPWSDRSTSHNECETMPDVRADKGRQPGDAGSSGVLRRQNNEAGLALTMAERAADYSPMSFERFDSESRRRRAQCGKSPQMAAARNARERRRVRAVNSAFVRLRRSLSAPDPPRRLSKLNMLRVAIQYIAHLQELLGYSRRDV